MILRINSIAALMILTLSMLFLNSEATAQKTQDPPAQEETSNEKSEKPAEEQTDKEKAEAKSDEEKVESKSEKKQADKSEAKKADDAKKTARKSDAAEFEVLFDGKSLDKFRGYKTEEIGKGWKIVDKKTVAGQPARLHPLEFDGSGGGDLVTKSEYADFDLRFEWRVEAGSNSGVMYRVSLGDGAPYVSGVEYQILDDNKHADGKNPMTSAASVYGLYKPENKKLKPVLMWNEARIVAQGNKVQHWLNRIKVAEYEIGSDDWNEKLANSKFKDWEKFAKNSKGHIAFQDHGDKVWYRNIRIKRLGK